MNVEKNFFSDQQQKNTKEKVNSRGQQCRDCSIEKRLGTKTRKNNNLKFGAQRTAHSIHYNLLLKRPQKFLQGNYLSTSNYENSLSSVRLMAK